jgi:hypothetical protein
MMDEDSVSRQPSTTERALTPSMVRAVRAERSRSARVLIGIGVGLEILVLMLLVCAALRGPVTPAWLLVVVSVVLVPVVAIGAAWLIGERGFRRALRAGSYLHVAGPAQIVERQGRRSSSWFLETSAGRYAIDRTARRAIPWATIDLIPMSRWPGPSAMVLRIEDDRGRVIYWHPNYRPTAADIPPP